MCRLKPSSAFPHFGKEQRLMMLVLVSLRFTPAHVLVGRRAMRGSLVSFLAPMLHRKSPISSRLQSQFSIFKCLCDQIRQHLCSSSPKLPRNQRLSLLLFYRFLMISSLPSSLSTASCLPFIEPRPRYMTLISFYFSCLSLLSWPCLPS